MIPRWTGTPFAASSGTNSARLVEERITHWRVGSFDEAMEQAEHVVEGAAFGPQGVTWDVDMVVDTANQMAGSQLSGFYVAERSWWGDHFYVVVTP